MVVSVSFIPSLPFPDSECLVSGELSTLWLSGMQSTSVSVAVSSCGDSEGSFTDASSEPAADGASVSAVTDTSLESPVDAELASGGELGAALCEVDTGRTSLFFTAVVASTVEGTGATGAVDVTAVGSPGECATVMGVSVTSVEVVADGVISASVSAVGGGVGVTDVLLSSVATGEDVNVIFSSAAELTDVVRRSLAGAGLGELVEDFSGSAVSSVEAGEADGIGGAVALALVAVSSSDGAGAVAGVAVETLIGSGGQQFDVLDCETSGVESEESAFVFRGVSVAVNEGCCEFEFDKVSESSWLVVGVEVSGEADAATSRFES